MAGVQHGAVARRQLRDLGLSDRQIDHAQQGGRLHRVHRAVFALGHPRLSATGRWSAATLACGPRAVLGYRTAAALLELRPSAAAGVDVVVPHRGRPAHRGITIHCHPTLGDDETTVHSGIATTTVARTLLDLAGVVSHHQIRRAIAQAEVLRNFDRYAVERLLARHPRHRGHRALAGVLRSWQEPDRLRSVLEARFLVVCTRNGLPRPIMNGTVLGMEIDAHFPEHRVAVELDGRRFHDGMIQREDDYAKRARLAVAGWTVLSFTYRQVTEDRGRFVRESLAPLVGAGPRLVR